MLDNLRNQDSSPFFQDTEEVEVNKTSNPETSPKKNRVFSGSFFGLKPQQTFILLLRLFLVVFLVGTMFLMVTGKIVP